jgi:hypothetical protein
MASIRFRLSERQQLDVSNFLKVATCQRRSLHSFSLPLSCEVISFYACLSTGDILLLDAVRYSSPVCLTVRYSPPMCLYTVRYSPSMLLYTVRYSPPMLLLLLGIFFLCVFTVRYSSLMCLYTVRYSPMFLYTVRYSPLMCLYTVSYSHQCFVSPSVQFIVR